VATAEFHVPGIKKYDQRSPARWISSHIFRYWWLVIIMLIGAFSNAALAAAVPILIGRAFNAILQAPPDINQLGEIALWVAASQILRGALQLTRNFGAELIGQKLERDIRSELYLSLLGKSMTFFNLQPVGDTMARATNDVREINLMFNPGFNLVIGSANFLLLPLILTPTFHPSLILVPILFLISYVLSLWQYLTELRPITDRSRDAFGRLNARLTESIDGIEIVKGNSQEAAEVSRFSKLARNFRDAFVWQGDVEARFLPLLLFGLASAGALLHALILFRQGVLDVGQVIAYVGLVQLFGFPTFVSLFAYSQVSLGMAGARRILELINRKTDLDQNQAGIAREILGEVEFRNLSYGFDDEDPILKGLNFHVSPGETIAIVGQTGSGKTTVAKMINRTFDASKGRVLIDGEDVREWDLEALRRQISIIEQDVFLFSRTIAENISFGRPDATEDEIRSAAQSAQAHDFIMSFEEGYQTWVGDRGVTLSGGQRQRIALARAFLTHPRILILDDSTSSIDSATEDQIQRAIFQAAEGRTTFIITHRLSQIRWADQILVLRNGQAVAMGDHEHLLKVSDAYQRIFANFGDD
jgi:ATP-binding cassette, subfamily B, bacterial